MPKDDYADLDGVRLHFVSEGDGEPVVLLHGFPDFWYSWRNQIPALAEAGYRAIAPDMRGYNLSDKPSGASEYAIEKLTGDVSALIRHLGYDRATVVGHDWGAIVAWYFAMHHPDQLERLVILNVPHPMRLRDGFTNPRQWLKSWYIFLFQIPELPERLLELTNYGAIRRLPKDANPGSFTDEDVQLYLEAAKRSNALREPINYYRAAGRAAGRLRSDIRLIEQPVLVLWGENDPYIESSLGEPPNEWVPDLTFQRFPNATHWVHMDEPEAVNRALLAFLGAGHSL